MSRASKHRDLVKLLQANARGSLTWDVFRDFNELAALALANSVDLRQFDAREERYLSIVKRYSAEDVKRFADALGCLVEAMEAERGDVMGTIMGELELGNAARGQFFTPYHLCEAMARLMVGDGQELRAKIEKRGFIRVNEPAVGGGAMVIAFATAMQDAGLNYQKHLHVVAQDVDPRAVHMAFVQFTLLHIPAVVVLGNTLALEEHEHWFTPAHILDFWDNKLRRGYALGSLDDIPAADHNVAVLPAPAEGPEIRMPAQGDMFELLVRSAA